MFTPSTAHFGQLARFIALGKHDRLQALAIAEKQRASDKVINVLKAVVNAHSTSDTGFTTASADYRAIATGFVELLRSRSMFYNLLEGGNLARVPLRTRLGVVTQSATGDVLAEGVAAPVSKMALSGPALEPVKAVALIVVTDDIIKTAAPGAQALLSRELRNSVAAAVDLSFWRMLDGDDTVSIPATADPLADLRAALAAVSLTGSEDLVFLASPDVAVRASTYVNAGGVRLFPLMGPAGGQMLNVPVLVSGALPAGTLALLDSSSVAAGSETITLDLSDSATLEMRDNPTADSVEGTPANQVSMFQTNSVAFRSVAWFAAERFRQQSFALINNVNW
jgi:hypothetical protein